MTPQSLSALDPTEEGSSELQVESVARAGGRATEAGMSFQAAVATWFAAHLLARQPVGGRFGLNNFALPDGIRLETGDGLDDIAVSQSDGGTIDIQCKTRATLAMGERSPLVKTVSQLARFVADIKSTGSLPDITRSVALLAVRTDAPRSLDDLDTGCRAFDLGGEWGATRSQRNRAQRAALDTFETIATGAWAARRGAAPSASDLTDMARFFRIARFAMDEGEADWREASRLLGRHLYGAESAGDAPLRDLKTIMRDLIESGAPADRSGLLRALRTKGHDDVGAPGFESDIALLREASTNELARLAIHGRLPLKGGVPITRASDLPLASAIRSGALLVVGEPGAGKTGALVHAASALVAVGETVLFLSVDRFPGVAIAADLASELHLAHPLIEVLAAFPGTGRKILFIDALDAARGGSSEGVFAALIEDVRTRLADVWTVVASIRTFDLRNGRRFRSAFAGEPPDPRYVEPGFNAIRHFLVPRLADADLAAAGAVAPALVTLLASAPAPLKALFHNIFNLSLAAQLLDGGADPEAFRGIYTQSGLIDAYEDLRLNTTALQQAAAAVVATMTERRRLAIRKVMVAHSSLDAVIQAGVLTESGDLVSFAHHVLFDHIAGRFHLAWDEPVALLAQLEGDTSTALLLAPALRFAVERLWRSDRPGRPGSWALIEAIFAARADAVLGNVALRIAVENVEDENDVGGLIAIIGARPRAAEVAHLLGPLARFVAIDIEAAGSAPMQRAVAWARVAAAVMVSQESALVDSARFLLHALFEKADLASPTLGSVFGEAARSLLRFAWDSDPPLKLTATNAIRFVGKSFASDPAESRALLDRVLREPHFSEYADSEAAWLAEQIRTITRADPTFAIEIYGALYGQTITDSATSWFGGQRSRIMPLSSNRRQDFEHCHWLLGTAMGDVLDTSAGHGTRALIDATIGKTVITGYESRDEPDQVDLGHGMVELRGHDIELSAWDETNPDDSRQDDDLLAHYVGFLRRCAVPAFVETVEAASRGYATGAVWARILGVGAERVTEVGDLLWPLVEKPDLLEHSDTLRDAIRFVAAAYPLRSDEERNRFELMALDDSRFAEDEDRQRWRHILGRLLGLVPEDQWIHDGMRALRRNLDAEGELSENRPLRSFTSDWGDRGDHVRRQLRRAGVDVDSGPNSIVLARSDALHELVQSTPSDSSVLALAALWSNAEALLALVDAHTDVLHDQINHSAWGHVSNAVERVASSAKYTPGVDGLPILETVLALLRRLSGSRYPEPRESSQ